ncbi:unnamed protein product, partial [Didymodactylos carnosus]
SHCGDVSGIIAPCVVQNWLACGLNVGSAIYSQYGQWKDDETRQLFGTTCTSSFRGGFHSWKWTYSGEFQCPSISPTIVGESTQWESRNGAIEHAIQNFITQAGQAGVLTPQQVQDYTDGAAAAGKRSRFYRRFMNSYHFDE